MAEYIKQKIQGGKKSICDSCTHRNVCKAIDNQPCTECNHYQCTADVEPVKRGRWIKESDGGTRCSVCNKRVRDVTGGWDEPVDLSDMPYCPKCGARMNEEVNT